MSAGASWFEVAGVWLIALAVVLAFFVGSDDDPDDEDDEDWTPPMLRRRRVAPVLDRAALLELPYSPVVSDEDALRALEEIRSLPERVAS